MSKEIWKDVKDCESLYEVSNMEDAISDLEDTISNITEAHE